MKGKAEAAYQTILSIGQDRNFKNIEMEAIWKLYDTCIVPLITYGAAAWDAKKSELRELDKIQESIVKRILMTPTSTPNATIYAETGLLDTEHIEYRERINTLIRIENGDNSNLKSILSDSRSDWKEQTKEKLAELDIPTNLILQPGATTKRIINNKIMNHMKHKKITHAQDQSKFQHLTKGENNYSFQRKKYMNKLNRIQLSTIFKARTRMLDVKANFKSAHRDLKCRLCGNAEETQRHVLQECCKIHKDSTTKVINSEIFEDENMSKLRDTAKAIQEIMDILHPEDKDLEGLNES